MKLQLRIDMNRKTIVIFIYVFNFTLVYYHEMKLNSSEIIEQRQETRVLRKLCIVGRYSTNFFEAYLSIYLK